MRRGDGPLARKDFRRLLGISFTVALGFGMVVPVLPLYARSFGVSLAAISLIQVVFGLTRFSFGLGAGLVVDRYGERASTIAGLLIVSASSFGAAMSTNFLQLVVTRGFGGVGSALFINGMMSRILKMIEPAAMARATGAFRSSFLLGIGAGPALGGFVAGRFGLASPFYFYGFGLLAATAIAFVVMAGGPAHVRPTTRKSPLDALRAARPLLRDIRYDAALLATFVGWWTIAGPAQVYGVIFARDNLGFSKGHIGIALTLLSVGELLILLIAGRAADRFGRRAVLVPALVATGATCALFGQIEAAPWLIYVLMLLLGAGIGAGGVSAGGLLADSIPKEGSGAAVGLNQMAGDLGYLISPAVFGALAEGVSFGAAYLVAAVPAAIVLTIALRLPGGTRDADEHVASTLERAHPMA
ncbi:MAG: MFS transporter [Actinomycetota bacterium]|nr:MFS transporter [Actinomycetota bacterium]